jgi:hypothetical protein
MPRDDNVTFISLVLFIMLMIKCCDDDVLLVFFCRLPFDGSTKFHVRYARRGEEFVPLLLFEPVLCERFLERFYL